MIDKASKLGVSFYHPIGPGRVGLEWEISAKTTK